MNFPNNQQTGAVSEIDVERLFLSWGWNVGQDRIDVGYDLCVMPDRNKYYGARFLVQVKGTARKNSKEVIVAQVAKSRLRQYAEDVLPVFIVRVLPNGCIYWIHSQAWALSNSDKLSGNGYGGVRFDGSQQLSDRQAFEAYLLQVLSNSKNALLALEEESRFLNSLDPKLGINLSIEGKAKKHEMYAKSEDLKGHFVFSPLQSPENIKGLHEALEFGLPRAVEVKNFKMTGSPVFDHIGASSSNSGVLRIGPKSSRHGVVRLYPGQKFSITASEFTLAADLYSGSQGIAITNENKDSIFDLSVRITFGEKFNKLTLHIDTRLTVISALQIQNIDELKPIAQWAEQVISQQSMFLDLDFQGMRVSVAVPSEELKNIMVFLQWVRTLSKLYLVARVLNSTVKISTNSALSNKDIDDIDLAYALLKGERRLISIESLEFEHLEHLEHLAGSDHKFHCSTILSFTVLEQVVGDIPVGIEFFNYRLEQISESRKKRLSKDENSQAWISYSESSRERLSTP